MNRRRNVLVCLCSLIAGGGCYVIFRDGSHIAKVFDSIEFVVFVRRAFLPFHNDFLCFHLPDCLWAISLSTGIAAIYAPCIKGVLAGAFVAFLCGAAWETLQFVGLVGGTGDAVDVAMYLLGSCISIILNFKKEKKLWENLKRF